jgi:DNA polymerase-1
VATLLGAPARLASSAQGTNLPFSRIVGAMYTIGDQAPAVASDLVRYTPDLAVDIETAGLGHAAMQVKSVTVGSVTHGVVLDPRNPVQWTAIRDVLRQARSLILHNSPFDVPILARHGLLSLDDIVKVVDTLIYCRLAEPDITVSKSLLSASARYLGGEAVDDVKAVFRDLGYTQTEGWRAFDLTHPVYRMAAALDAVLTARLLPVSRQAALDRITRDHPYTEQGVHGTSAERLVEREQTLNRVFLRRAARGLRVDLDFLERYRAGVVRQQDQDALLLESQGIKPGHGGSLAAWMSNEGLVPFEHPRTPTGMLSTQDRDLAEIDHEVVRAFRRLKKTTKIDKDYLDKVADMADDERIHPTTSMLAAVTGRMSMSDPPLHQFPPDARGIILADEGDELTSIDWAQIEPVVAANIAGDTRVLKHYETQVNGDLYRPIVDFAGISRKAAKVVVLAQLYGEGIGKLARDLDVSEDRARQIREQVFKAMPAVTQMIYGLKAAGEKHEQIITLSGRILPIPTSGQYGVQVHKAVNYFVQGSAYDMLAEALVRINQAGLSDHVYLALHDEVVVSTAVADEVVRIMQRPPLRLCTMARRVPVLRVDRADIGVRWQKAG